MRPRPAAEPLHRRHPRRRDAHQPRLRPGFATEDPDTVRAVFYGLGSDGTVGANKNSIKIIGEETDNYAQGYFVYDSKKSGSVTVSHLRFGPRPIRSTYLISRAKLRRLPPVLASWSASTCCAVAEPGATFLLNSPYGPDEVWDHLPRSVQETDHRARSCVSSSSTPSRWRTRPAWAAASTPSCRPASSPSAACCRARRRSRPSRRRSSRPTASAARPSCDKNCAAVDAALAHLHEVQVPARPSPRSPTGRRSSPPRRRSSSARSRP